MKKRKKAKAAIPGDEDARLDEEAANLFASVPDELKRYAIPEEAMQECRDILEAEKAAKAQRRKHQ